MMFRLISTAILAMVLLVVAVSAATVGPAHAAQNNSPAGDGSQAYRTRTGKTIVVSETHPAGRSLATIEVRTQGFEHNYMEVFEGRHQREPDRRAAQAGVRSGSRGSRLAVESRTTGRTQRAVNGRCFG
jgi:hypothetical protein